MILVDSSVWADYFNGTDTVEVVRLDRAFREEEDLMVIPIIITEVLQGFRSETGYRRARRILVSIPRIHPSLDCHVRAAQMFRRLRRQGVTVRGAVDCVIAQTCLELRCELLSTDADFRQIARHTALRLWDG